MRRKMPAKKKKELVISGKLDGRKRIKQIPLRIYKFLQDSASFAAQLFY